MATLSGGDEVPANASTATGDATFTLDGDQLDYTVNVTGLENPVVAHIHVAAAGANGPVRLNLCGTGAPQPACGTGDGVLATGTNGTTVGDPAITFDDLVEAMRDGGPTSTCTPMTARHHPIPVRATSSAGRSGDRSKCRDDR